MNHTPLKTASVASPRPIGVRKPENNKLQAEDRAAHDWYRFVLSFPPHLVRDYLCRFELREGQCVLDPFCGTGTTIVECKKNGLASVGIERNPMAHFASEVKCDWTPDPDGLLTHSAEIAEIVTNRLSKESLAAPSLRGLPEESDKLLLTNSISPLPLHKTLTLLDTLRSNSDERYRRHQLLALAKALVTRIGNLHFGPEVGVGPAKDDAPVVEAWLNNVRAISDDLRLLRSQADVTSKIHHADSRQMVNILAPQSVDAVITNR